MKGYGAAATALLQSTRDGVHPCTLCCVVLDCWLLHRARRALEATEEHRAQGLEAWAEEAQLRMAMDLDLEGQQLPVRCPPRPGACCLLGHLATEVGRLTTTPCCLWDSWATSSVPCQAAWPTSTALIIKTQVYLLQRSRHR